MGIPDKGLGRVHPLGAGPGDWGTPEAILDSAKVWLQGDNNSYSFENAGRWSDNATYIHRQPNGAMNVMRSALPCHPTMPVVRPALTTVVMGKPDMNLAEAEFHPRFASWAAPDAIDHVQSLAITARTFYIVDGPEDFAGRVLPAVLAAQGATSLITPFAKLWLYLFASTQGRSLGANPQFEAVAGIPMTAVENKNISHLLFDAATGEHWDNWDPALPAMRHEGCQLPYRLHGGVRWNYSINVGAVGASFVEECDDGPAHWLQLRGETVIISRSEAEATKPEELSVRAGIEPRPAVPNRLQLLQAQMQQAQLSR